MTGSTYRKILGVRQDLVEMIRKDHKSKTGKNGFRKVSKSDRVSRYISEIDSALDILEDACEVSIVSYGLIRVLNESGKNEIEPVYIGSFVQIQRVKLTGTYFLAMTPIKKI